MEEIHLSHVFDNSLTAFTGGRRTWSWSPPISRAQFTQNGLAPASWLRTCDRAPSNKSLLLSDRVFKGVRLRYAAPDLIRFAPAAERQIR